MLRFPGDKGAWQRRVRDWLRDNDSFRQYVLREIRRRGPLKSHGLEDRAVRPWPSAGWTRGRNVTQILDFLSARGEIMVSRREGGQRVWDLPERVLPPPALRTKPASARIAATRRLHALGLARASPMFRGAGEPIRVSGIEGEWIADPEALDHVDEPLTPRMTLLFPFDRLIHDRERAEDLFGFRCRTEIYVPKAKRRYGSYALPVLHGERLVGRIDMAFNRGRKILRIQEVYPEPGATLPWRALRTTVRNLGEFLEAAKVEGV